MVRSRGTIVISCATGMAALAGLTGGSGAIGGAIVGAYLGFVLGRK